jgi:sulfur transfer protein SufE
LSSVPESALIGDYLRLGLALGRHVDGFVDAYYGPPELASRVAGQPAVAPLELVERARRLLADLGSTADLTPERRQWLAAQVRGLHTSARQLAGDQIGYLDEIESCYGVRPTFVPEDDLAQAHQRLDRVLPGRGPLADRYIAWREAQVVPPGILGRAVDSLAEDFRARTIALFGLPDGERVEFEMVVDQPWSGFNYYLGGLRSRVAINLDLPVLSTVLGSLVAHESYPGHHTEHCRKEAGLVRRQRQDEETIFLVGTPQCLIAEGLADLGLEVVAGERPEPVLEEHFRPLGIPYDAGVAAEVSSVSDVLGAVRGNAAILLHDRGRSLDEATAYLEKWALSPRVRAAKAMQFATDPTWRAYVFCYIDGLRLCREYVKGDPTRFERLVTEQLVPSQLTAS